ncbi:hypothetical protein G9272_01875 [Streptomyces asoensis]|uniref:Uncharacterized protein n=1 Tax=Streptomyces asoensis TaxID=249586 RepID=A0A6M4WEW9_9ACTN|nr:hypothetical protein [Streptomyces asoensis]QJS99216.1 hypothetical protein G9272_01875 [Streptomyces asoensis]
MPDWPGRPLPCPWPRRGPGPAWQPRLVRYPGGSYADGYRWQTHTVEGGHVAPNTEFDAYMGTARAAGPQPIITADHGSGAPKRRRPGGGMPM